MITSCRDRRLAPDAFAGRLGARRHAGRASPPASTRADPPQARPLTSLAEPGAAGARRASGDAADGARRGGRRPQPRLARRRRRSSARWARVPASVEPMAALPDAVLFKGTLRARDQGGDGPAHRPGQRQPLRRAHMIRVLKGNERGKVLHVGARRQRADAALDHGAGRPALRRAADAQRQHRRRATSSASAQCSTTARSSS